MSEHISIIEPLELRPGGPLPGDPDWLDSDAPTLCGDEIARFTDVECLDTLTSARRLRARADAIETQAVERLRQIRGDARGTDQEVAHTLRITRHHAQARLHRARQLVRRHPVVLQAMHDGHLEGYAAGRVVDVTDGLTDEDAAEVDRRLEGKLARDGHTPGDVRRLARRTALKVNPDALAKKAVKARADRKVELVPEDDAVSTLLAILPAEVAAAAYASLDTAARRLRRGGEERTLDQLRADILADRLTHPWGTTDTSDNGTGCARRGSGGGAQVMLHVPIDAALAITDDGCHLDGYGPIPGPIARHIMGHPDSTWRKVICDPGSGKPQDLGRTRYCPSPAIRDLVTIRDRECTIAGCHRAALACDYDHIRSRNNGGPTSVNNGQPHCEYHNNLKEEPGWRIETDRKANTTTIIGPAGQRITQHHRPILKPELPPDPDPLPEEPPF